VTLFAAAGVGWDCNCGFSSSLPVCAAAPGGVKLERPQRRAFRRGRGRTRWCKDVAPSDELRKWYGHDPGRFKEFGRRYRVELQGPRQAEALLHLSGLAKDRRLTLLTGTRQPEMSEAAVLAALLRADHNG
jgi:uncharacterized protein YeaO (DUF488 family)